MPDNNYLDWVIRNTRTCWWHDSADPAELQLGLDRGAVGVTTNPFLSSVSFAKNRARWEAETNAILARNLPAEEKAEALMRIVVTQAAGMYQHIYEKSGGTAGFVCAQVNPSRAGLHGPLLGQHAQCAGH